MMPSHTAMHEASHLVAAHLLGLATSSATVVPTRATRGLVRFKDAAEVFEADPDKARRLMVATLAPRAACKHYADPGAGCQEDDDQVWALARRVVGDHPRHAQEIALVVEEAWAEAVELVEDHPQAIADVARCLDLFGALKGAGLAAMVARYVEQDKASPAACRHRETRRAFRRWIEEQQHGGNNDGND